MESNTSSGMRLPRGLYKVYRKYRYLKHRGTLIRKYPKRIYKRRKSKAWRFLHRSAFLFKRGALHRFLRYQKQLALSANCKPRGYELITGHGPATLILPLTPASVKPLSFRERIRRARRKIRYVNAKRKRLKRIKALQKSRSFSRFYVIYRKVRYLARTGKLFRFDIPALTRAVNRFLSHFGNPEMITISINSTLIFLLAYLFVFLIRLFSVAAAASSFNISTIIFYFDIDFLIRSSQWGKDSVMVVYSAGPFISLIVSIFAIIAYAGVSHESWRIRLFLLWVFCHAFIQSLGEVMVGSLLNQGFGYVIIYMLLADTEKMLLSFLIFLVIITVGFAVRRIFLFSGNIYFNVLNRRNRLPFIVHQFLIPFLAGTLLIILLKQPRMTGFEIAIIASMAVLLLPVVILGSLVNDLYYDEEPRKIRIFWFWLLAAAILLPVFRVVMGMGIRI